MKLINDDPPPLLTTIEAAASLSVSPKTLAYWRATGDGPSFSRIGAKTIRYRRADLLTYVDERQRRHDQNA